VLVLLLRFEIVLLLIGFFLLSSLSMLEELYVSKVLCFTTSSQIVLLATFADAIGPC